MDTNQFKFLMYRSADGDVSVNAIIKDETIWLTQKAMAELFGVQVPAISKHLKTSSPKVNWMKNWLFPKWK